VACDTGTEKVRDVGRFIQIDAELWTETDTEPTPYVLVQTREAEWKYTTARHDCYLVTSITRKIAVTRGQTADVHTAQCAARIATLRTRLDKLTESDEISDCTARFKLEKQIYDLEREQMRDEWPEVIGAEGGA
jgi:hypothetical protein